MSDKIEKRKVLLRFFILLFVLIAGSIILYFTPLGYYLQPERLKSFILSFGFIAPLIYIALYTLKAFAPFPSSILSLSGGLAFNTLYGGIYTIIGTCFSATLAFFLAKALGRSFVEKILGKRFKKIDESIHTYGFRVVLFFRVVPLLPFDVVNYGAGLSKVEYKDYLLGTVIGTIPWAFAWGYLGSSLGNLYPLHFVIAGAIVILLLSTPFIYRRIKTRLPTPSAHMGGQEK